MPRKHDTKLLQVEQKTLLKTVEAFSGLIFANEKFSINNLCSAIYSINGGFVTESPPHDNKKKMNMIVKLIFIEVAP